MSTEQSSGVGRYRKKPVVIYTESERLYRLAKGVLEILDAERQRTGVDEWDESDHRCFLYNAAYAVIERNVRGGDQHLDDCLEGFE